MRDVFYFDERMKNNNQLASIYLEEIVLKPGLESIQELKKLQVSEKDLELNNFQLLTLSIWCKNLDLFFHLASIDSYVLKALNNIVFCDSMQNLEKFDSDIFIIYEDIKESVLLKQQMYKDILLSENGEIVSKF